MIPLDNIITSLHLEVSRTDYIAFLSEIMEKKLSQLSSIKINDPAWFNFFKITKMLSKQFPQLQETNMKIMTGYMKKVRDLKDFCFQ